MAQPYDIREVLLAEIKAQEPRDRAAGPTLQYKSIIEAAARKLNANFKPDLEEAILTQWGELLRTGLVSWGLNISNPGPPFFHLTERGRQVLRNLTRDPSNPAGYLAHLASVAALDAIPLSYLAEGLECYVGSLFKASAVMVGAAAERLILDLRDALVQRLNSLQRPVAKDMTDWRVKTVSDALYGFFERNARDLERELRESFEAYWPAFTQQIRAVRNDAGHPASIDPVTPDTVHASLLIFPELAKLVGNLSTWVMNELK